MAPAPPRTHQLLIRFSLLMGVVLFGIVTWFLHRDPAWTPAPDVFGGRVRLLTIGVWLVAISGILFARQRWARAADDATRHAFAVGGLALAEGAALFGGVVYFLSDDARLLVAGIFLMLGALVLFPVRATS